MQYTTWGEFRTKVEREHDIQEDPDFLASGELGDILNDGIDKCEQHFIKIPGYFLASTSFTLVPGQRDYTLPSDIYGNKIRNIMHDNYLYEVKQMRDIKDRAYQEQATGDWYKYIIINNAGTGPAMRLFPTPQESSTLTMEYIRNAARIDSDGLDTQEIDIPEAMGFIYAYTEWRLRKKEKILSEVASAEVNMNREMEDMLNALSVMVDDENNEIEPDVSIYKEHV